MVAIKTEIQSAHLFSAARGWKLASEISRQITLYLSSSLIFLRAFLVGIFIFGASAEKN